MLHLVYWGHPCSHGSARTLSWRSIRRYSWAENVQIDIQDQKEKRPPEWGLVVNSVELWDQCKCWQPSSPQKPTNEILLWKSLLTTWLACGPMLNNFRLLWQEWSWANLCQKAQVWVPSSCRQRHVELFLPEVLQCQQCTGGEKHNHQFSWANTLDETHKWFNWTRIESICCWKQCCVPFWSFFVCSVNACTWC